MIKIGEVGKETSKWYQKKSEKNVNCLTGELDTNLDISEKILQIFSEFTQIWRRCKILRSIIWTILKKKKLKRAEIFLCIWR